MTWIDWQNRDRVLEAHVVALAGERMARLEQQTGFPEGGHWLRSDGAPMTIDDWHNPATHAVSYVAPATSSPMILEIDRSRRLVGWRRQP